MYTSSLGVTLLACVGVICVFWAAGWIVVSALDIARAATVSFAASNLLMFAAVVLITQRGPEPSWLLYPLPDFCVILAMIVVHSGIQRLLRQPGSFVTHLVLVAVCAAGLIAAGPTSKSLTTNVLILMAGMSLLSFFCVRTCVRGLEGEFGLPITLAISFPFLLLATLAGGRVAWRLMHWGTTGESVLLGQAGDALSPLWGFLISLLLIDIALLGITVGRLIAKASELADTDVLTGIWNRRALMSRFEEELERQRRSGQPLSLAICDVDFFKRINDAFGHAGGDAVLRHSVDTMRRSLRDLDVLGRFGGEEFIVLMPMTDLNGATGAAERLRAALADSPANWKGRAIPVTASFGVAEVGTHSDSVFRRADEALYRAKERGRNRVETDGGLRAVASETIANANGA